MAKLKYNGEQLKALTKDRKITQYELANEIASSQTKICSLFNGKEPLTKEWHDRIIAVLDNPRVITRIKENKPKKYKSKEPKVLNQTINTVKEKTKESLSFNVIEAMNTHKSIDLKFETPTPQVVTIKEVSASLESRIKECKQQCLDNFGFEVEVIKVSL